MYEFLDNLVFWDIIRVSSGVCITFGGVISAFVRGGGGGLLSIVGESIQINLVKCLPVPDDGNESIGGRTYEITAYFPVNA